MGVEKDLPYWLSIWGDTLARAKPPYTGVNLMTVKKSNLGPCLESLRDQTEYIAKVGGEMTSLTMRESDDHCMIIWCMYYPPEVNWTDPDLEEATRRNSFKVAPEMFEMIESYDWYLLESGSLPFPSSTADIFRQVPPPSAEQLSIAEQHIMEYRQDYESVRPDDHFRRARREIQ